MSGIDVLWQGAVVPWWLIPITVVVAAQGGLVRVIDVSQAAPVVSRLAHLAMVELYSFHAELLPAVVQHVREAGWRARVGNVVGNDASYFALGIDGDSHHSDTGLFAWASHGAECPAELKAVLVRA